MQYFFIFIIQAIIFGFATKIVIENKGYDDNWFWWGFFFGLIALIVACAKPQNINYATFSSSQHSRTTNTSYPSSYGNNLNKDANRVYNEQILTNGGWKCSCGRVHASYVSSCSCGKSKSDVLNARLKKKQEDENKQAEQQKQGEAKKQIEATDEMSKVSAIKEYKELMDAGVISQEEFEAKKKQLLGL